MTIRHRCVIAGLVAGVLAAAIPAGDDGAHAQPGDTDAPVSAPQARAPVDDAKDTLVPLPDWGDQQSHAIRRVEGRQERWWQAVRREIPACASYTDGCHVCRIDDQGATCSNTPIACQPTQWRCDAQQ